MDPDHDPLVALTTVGAADDAERIARALVDERLAACVNVVPGVVSVYRWQGAVERDGEWLLLIKTSSGRLEALRERLVALHPYQLPELIALRIEDGWPPYLAWIAHSLEHDG
jgi:periplasmic divalent cation tolerance protein